MSEKITYGFAVGRVRAQETTLLDRSRYDRLVRAADVAEFRAALADTYYGRYSSGEAAAGDSDQQAPQRPGGFGQTLARAAADNFAFLALYCGDRWVLDAFRHRADIHNLKLAVKNRLLGTEPSEPEFLDFGAWTPEQVRALAETEPKAGPDRARRTVESLAVGPGDRDPAAIDATLDRLEQELVMELVRPSPFLTMLLGLHADVENLRTFSRLKAAGRERAALDRSFLLGGKVPLRMLADMLGAEPDVVAARFRFSRYRFLVEEGLGQTPGRGAFRRMERIGRELLLGWLKLARYAGKYEQ